MTTKKLPSYDFRTLLRALGSDQEICDLIERLGYTSPPPTVVRGWRTRRSIPSRWLPLLLAHLLETEGIKPGNLIETNPFGR
jgi:hypothetical protein